MNMETPFSLEGSFEFRSLAEWRNAPPFVRSREKSDLIGRIVSQKGLSEPLGRSIQGPDIVMTSSLREGIIAEQLMSRHRAILKVMADLGASDASHVYAAEAVTPFAGFLRDTFPRFIGSEFAKDEEARLALLPVRHEDLMDLSFDTGSFDFVVTADVLEHVPDIDLALASMRRVLRRGGHHVGSVPFLYEQEDSDVRARIIDGEICFYAPPEFHGNPISDEGALVFEIPAWDLLDRAKAAGFSDARMEVLWSSKHGIAAEDGGVFVLILTA